MFKILSQLIHIKVIINICYSFFMLLQNLVVYFTFTGYLNSDRPHFKCSIAMLAVANTKHI